LKGRILVVDDDHALVRIAQSVLQKQGFDVLTAFDGLEGLQKAQEEKPDVIVLDIFMPVMDGYTTLTAIKGSPATKDIPVIILTAVGYDLSKRMAQDFGAAAYITKPVNPSELADAVVSLLETSRQSRSSDSTAHAEVCTQSKRRLYPWFRSGVSCQCTRRRQDER